MDPTSYMGRWRWKLWGLRILVCGIFRGWGSDSWLRWHIAARLDKRRDTCWADLVSYARGDREGGFWGWRDFTNPDRDNAADNWMCLKDRDRNGACWCGKYSQAYPERDA